MDGQQDAGRLGVAVLGMSGRFPGADSPADFWANLRAGRESITVLGEEPLAAAGAGVGGVRATAPVRACGQLTDVSGFDARFFGLGLSEACALHPQHRLFLECAWEAFEDAGYVAERVEGPVAVFAAPGSCARSAVHRAGTSRGAAMTVRRLRDREVLATLVSRELNLTGPSMDVQTAGGSSLAAVHLACQSLLNGECDMALAGSSTVRCEEDGDGRCREGDALSPDGHCRPFDARAAGTILASAVACLVLKRLEDAVAAGDRIRAVIRASTINNSGARQAGDEIPGLAPQVRAVGEALAMAGVRADEVSYIEAHAAGTRSGDSIEILALTKAFRAQTAETRYCAVGSVKGNIGHAGEAAGIAGLVKVILALQHRQIPATLHVGHPNPDAHFDDSPFYVNTTLKEWDVAPGRRRIAGVTALGEGGTNVHVVVEDAPEAPPGASSREHQLLVLSAHTPAALDTLTAKLAVQLGADPGVSLADVAFTLAAGRKPFRCRRALVARSAADAALALAAANRAPVITNTAVCPLSVSWMFSGDEPYVGMGAGLYAGEPAYREAFDEALSGLDAEVAADVRRITGSPFDGVIANDQPWGPSRTLPALVAVEYAIGCLLEAWGLSPAGTLADGAGVYAAACFAGVLDIHEAIDLAAIEGQLRGNLEGSAYAATGEGPATIDEARAQFVRFCRTKRFKAPTGHLVSNVTGRWVTGAEATDPVYWGDRFGRVGDAARGLPCLLAQSPGALVAIGPGRSLSRLLEQQPRAPALTIATLRDPEAPDSDVAILVGAAGRLWAAGAAIDPTTLVAGERRRRIGLPTYPFERQRCTPDSEPGTNAARPRLATAPPPPSNELQRELAAMWREVLDVVDVGADEDFFELGGHSLNAVRLFDRIRNRFGVDLPLATLFEARTITALSSLIRDRLADLTVPGTGTRPRNPNAAPPAPAALRSLVAVQPGAGGPPLFVVHGAAGHVLNVVDLARSMGPSQAVFGLQASGVDGVSPARATIEEMAQSYLDEVRLVQRRGPYLLAGYSGGGIVAFEMARRLDAAGDAIGLLALIDTFHPQMPRPRITAWTRLGRLGREGIPYVREGLARALRSYRQARREQLIDEHLAAGEPIPLALRESHLIRSFERAVRWYAPAPWSGRALLFKAEQVDYYHRAGGPAYGWDATITGGLEVVKVPGDHDSIMIGANATRIARRLAEAIELVKAGAIRGADR